MRVVQVSMKSGSRCSVNLTRFGLTFLLVFSFSSIGASWHDNLISNMEVSEDNRILAQIKLRGGLRR